MYVYMKSIYRPLKPVYRYTDSVYRPLKVIYRYMKPMYQYIKPVYRYMVGRRGATADAAGEKEEVKREEVWAKKATPTLTRLFVGQGCLFVPASL
jgi:hypothetical protein